MSPNKHLNLIGEGNRGSASACATTDEALRNIVCTERLVSDLHSSKDSAYRCGGSAGFSPASQLTLLAGYLVSSGALYGCAMALSRRSSKNNLEGALHPEAGDLFAYTLIAITRSQYEKVRIVLSVFAPCVLGDGSRAPFIEVHTVSLCRHI